MTDTPKKTSRVSQRGFASMSRQRRREIARKGGAAVPAEKRSFSQDRALAVESGRKGGLKSRTRPKVPPITLVPSARSAQRDF